MKNLLLLFAFFGVLPIGFSQQDPAFTQFFSNKIVVNPAYAGTRDAISLNGLYRHQWTGFEGAPKTTTLSLHSPIEKYDMGVGLSLIHDQLGIQRNYSVKFAYSYRLNTSLGNLSFGLDAELKKQEMRWEDSNPLEENDLNIPYGQNSITMPNFGFGLYLYRDNYYIGLSAPKLLENELSYSDNGQSFVRRHFFGMAGVLIPLSDVFKIKPAVLVKYQPTSPIQVDINMMGIFYDVFRVGFTYRTQDSFDAIVQFHLNNNLRIGYAYDFTITDLSRVNSGSHEIMIGYDFNNRKTGTYNPRYF